MLNQDKSIPFFSAVRHAVLADRVICLSVYDKGIAVLIFTVVISIQFTIFDTELLNGILSLQKPMVL